MNKNPRGRPRGYKLKQRLVDQELAERIRQFEIVCLTRFALRKTTVGGSLKAEYKGSLVEIGRMDFGLTSTQIDECKGRMRNFLDEVQELAARKRRLGLPYDSDSMMSYLMHEKARRSRKAA